MRELLKAAVRFSWAMTLFGARQFGAVLSDRDSERTTSAFNSLAHVFEEEFSGMLRSVFQTGDSFQRGICDLGLTPTAYTPRGLTRTALSLMRQSAGVLAALGPRSDARSALREFQTKLEVFDLFENVDAKLRLSGDRLPSLEDLVERVDGIDPFTAVWMMEGIGHYYCETAWELTGTPNGLLTGVGSIPRKSLVPLHAGMGLSLANRLLARARSACRRCPTSGSLTDVLRQFVSLCKDNSSEAYLGASYEALGLIARNLYPHLVAEIDRELVQMGENLSDYFWHGVGRAIYFAPTNYVPGSARRVVELAQQEPPHELGRCNALAGASWAMVLVNLREPEVIEAVLVQCEGIRFDTDAFAHGVSSAALIWLNTTESPAELETLCRRQPLVEHPTAAERWNTLIYRPCRRVLNQYYAAAADACIGEVFRYHASTL